MRMNKEIVEFLVKGGHASAAPPIGPALAPMGVNIEEIINMINKKTELFNGMDVPVKIIIDKKTKKFEIRVGTPPVSSMLKRELKVEKLATVNDDKTRKTAGDIKLDTLIKITKSKEDSMSGNFSSKVSQVLGTCASSGVTVEGRNPKEIQKEIKQGKIKI